MPLQVSAAIRILQRARAVAHDLGPLRWVVLRTAVVPTIGLFVVLAHLRDLAAAWPGEPWLAFAAAVAAIAATTGAVLLPPGVAALAAGYCLGPWHGGAAAVLGSAFGAVLDQRVVWPIAGARLFAFMRPRPRVEKARRFCAGPFLRQAERVAMLRLAAPFPFAVINLILAVALVPARAVFTGSVLGIAPAAFVAAAAGAAWRTWRDRGEPPAGLAIAVFAVCAVAAVLAMLTARRAWRRAAAS